MSDQKNNEGVVKKNNDEDLLDANFLPADHQLLSRMQKAFEKQQREELERLKLDFIKKTKIQNQLEKEKENIGVQLYESQQKLVYLQRLLEIKNEEQKDVQDNRQKNEIVVKELSQNLDNVKCEQKELSSQLFKRIEELSKQNLTIKEIESFNKDIESDIKVKRRVTYKIEENIAEKERQKNRQDFLIFSLMEEQKKIQQQKDLIEVQLKQQRNETQSAQKLLQESQEEIDKICQSIKQLQNHLKKSHQDLEDKNKTLLMVKDKLIDQEEILSNKQNEILGYKKEIKLLLLDKAQLGQILDKLEKEGKTLEQQADVIQEKMNKTLAKKDILNTAYSTTEDEMKILEKEQADIKREMNIIEGSIMKFHTEIKKKHEEVLVLISNHKTKEKLHNNILKQIKGIEIFNQEKQLEMENLENEISRIQLDILNTENQIITLQDEKNQLNKERKDKENTINKYEIIIRENHDIHERKMHEVAKFNREHDKAQSKMELVGKGPSEIMLIQLNKEISDFHKQRKSLEGQFIKSQTRAVEREIYANNLSQKIISLSRKATILEQKKLRLNSTYNTYQKEISHLNKNLKNYEKDMNKLNDFLALFKDKKISIKNQIINVDSEFAEKLKNMEKEAAKVEVQIDKLKVQRAQILEETMECERQILLWERKIELEKEMQSALDPTVGQQEIKQLKKGYHLKKLKLNELTKNQDQLILEIEKVVNKRDNINLKYNARELQIENLDKDLFKKKPKSTKKNKLSQNIQLYKTSIKQTQSGISKLENEIQNFNRQNDEILLTIKQYQDTLQNNKNELQEQCQQIQMLKIQRLMGILNVFSNQQKAMSLQKIIKRGKTTKTNQHKKALLYDKKQKNIQFISTFKSICQENQDINYILPFLKQLESFVNNQLNKFLLKQLLIVKMPVGVVSRSFCQASCFWINYSMYASCKTCILVNSSVYTANWINVISVAPTGAHNSPAGSVVFNTD